jgi:hypothetical protein
VSKSLSIFERATCPSCGAAKPCVTLLTFDIVFLRCVKCGNVVEVHWAASAPGGAATTRSDDAIGCSRRDGSSALKDRNIQASPESQ